MRRSVLCLLTTLSLAGCTAGGGAVADRPAPNTYSGPAPQLRLVSYDSCDDLLESVREAAKRVVTPWGLPGNGWDLRRQLSSRAEGGPQASDAGKSATQPYSGTNTHEAGVDEPDIVKTDGRRIVTVLGETLRVIDTTTRQATGSLHVGYGSHQLFLQGDRALVLTSVSAMAGVGGIADTRMGYGGPSATRLRLVDLTGAPRVTGDYEIGAELTDARLADGTARVVVTSHPMIDFTWLEKGTDADRVAANRKVIDGAPLDRWLPAYTADGTGGRLDCGQVSRPAEFSGTSLVTVLSFDLSRATLGEGRPAAVLADARTVYGTGDHLYLAHDEGWKGEKAKDRTELYVFDVSGPQPFFAASGSVPGWLLNQYSLSEHDGVLRVATTSGQPWSTQERSESTVYTLRLHGGQLQPLGKLGGLGKGERIYAVRFLGPTGYVVTFRQTDPLYAIDLRDPARPVLAGELKIPGYSSYLHPVADGRLVGVGQDASEQGRVSGLQVSLFDVGSADPKRLDQEKVPNGYSEAEYDPHAFLYWPATGLLVVPYAAYDKQNRTGALLFRVNSGSLEKTGEVHPVGYPRRSLVVGDTLWVVADAEAMATSLSGAVVLARVNL
ncbi:beta-propeller domain-containing protein [Catellatospora vulcania]|uniref:beta-propeller domain-containing protein n=1 Tax=Catellatospora vulcania TaxID=1460450 RepID=UPI001E533BE5|nr:beta-propeller domain-containing protein [Catellatospora vulcania]